MSFIYRTYCRFRFHDVLKHHDCNTILMAACVSENTSCFTRDVNHIRKELRHVRSFTSDLRHRLTRFEKKAQEDTYGSGVMYTNWNMSMLKRLQASCSDFYFYLSDDDNLEIARAAAVIVRRIISSGSGDNNIVNDIYKLTTFVDALFEECHDDHIQRDFVFNVKMFVDALHHERCKKLIDDAFTALRRECSCPQYCSVDEVVIFTNSK